MLILDFNHTRWLPCLSHLLRLILIYSANVTRFHFNTWLAIHQIIPLSTEWCDESAPQARSGTDSALQISDYHSNPMSWTKKMHSECRTSTSKWFRTFIFTWELTVLCVNMWICGREQLQSTCRYLRKLLITIYFNNNRVELLSELVQERKSQIHSSTHSNLNWNRLKTASFSARLCCVPPLLPVWYGLVRICRAAGLVMLVSSWARLGSGNRPFLLLRIWRIIKTTQHRSEGKTLSACFDLANRHLVITWTITLTLHHLDLSALPPEMLEKGGIELRDSLFTLTTK